MPNGEESKLRQKLEEWQRKVNESNQQLTADLQRTEELRTVLEQPIPYVERVEEWTPGALWSKLHEAVDILTVNEATGLPKFIFSTSLEIQRAKQEARVELDVIADNISRNNFYVNTYTILPGMIQGGQITSIDDLREKVAIPPSITDEELGTLTEDIDYMVDLLTGELPEMAVEAEPIELPELVAPEPTPRFFLQRATVDEILKVLQSAAVPEQVLTDEQWNTYLTDSGQVDEDGKILDLEAQAEKWITQWQEQDAQIAAFKQDIADMPDYKLVDLMKEAVVQPGLAMMEVGLSYFRHVSMPLAGFVYKRWIPDVEAKYQEYKQTESTWMALGHAWEDGWETDSKWEWAYKYMLLEGLVDPISYIGWGVASRIFKPFGRMGLRVAAADRFIMEVLDIPMDILKAGLAKVPKTLTQRALFSQHRAGQLFRQALELDIKDNFRHATVEQLERFVTKAVKYARRHPQSEELLAQVGHDLLMHRPLTLEQVQKWSRGLKSVLSDEQITKETVDFVNSLLDDLVYKNTRITYKGASVKLLGKLVAENSDANLTLASKLLKNKVNTVIRNANLFGGYASPYDALRNLMKRNFKYFINIEESAAFLARMQASRFGILKHGVSTRIQTVWTNYIDKAIIRPFAEAYLTFFMYGPMNVAEDYVRSFLGGVRPGRSAIDDFESACHGLRWDPNLTRGVSETYGFIRRVAPEEQVNNWILQFFGLAKGFGERMYDVLVRRPAFIGSAIRRNFILGRYRQILINKGGDILEQLVRVGPARLEGVNKDITKRFMQVINDLKMTGNSDLVRSITNDFTRKKIFREELNNIFKLHPDLPIEVRQHALKSFDDGLLASPEHFEAFLKQADDIVMDKFIRSPEIVAEQIDMVAKQLAELEVTNPEQMAASIHALFKVQEVYGSMPNQVLGRATERSAGLPFVERNRVINQALDDIARFRELAGTSIDKLIERLRLTIKSPERLARANWEKVTFRGGTAKYKQQIMDIVDNLPLDIKFDITEIAFAPAKLRGMHAVYDFQTGRLLINSPKDITPKVLYHEAAHSELLVRAAKGDYTAFNEFMKKTGVNIDIRKVQHGMETIRMGPGMVKTLKARGFTDIEIENAKYVFVIRKLYGKEPIEHFAEEFAVHCSGIKQPEPIARIFKEYFPLTQQKMPFTRDYVTQGEHLFELLMTKRAKASELGMEIDTWRRAIFTDVSPQELKSQDFWDVFFHDSKANWNNFNKEMARLDGLISTSIDNLNLAAGVKATPRKAIIVRNRPLAPNDIARLLQVRGDDISRNLLDVLTAQNNKDYFVEYVMSKVRPDDIGFTRKSIGEVYDQITYGLGVRPEAMNWMTSKRLELNAVREDFHELFNSKLLPDNEIKAMRDFTNQTADAMDNLLRTPAGKLKPEFADLPKIRQDALDEAHKWFYKEYTDYTNANAFDSMMKQIYPFWTYESQRWQWLPRSFVRHPVVFTELSKYMDMSDYGYIHIPGTMVDVNPFRGTIYGTMTTRMVRQDYPEYYDSLPFAGNYVEFMDFLSRYGFYPGAHLGIPLALLGGQEAQFGEVLPAVWRTPLDAAVAMFPESDNVKALSQALFNDRFRDYVTIKEVTRRGGDGTLVYAKMKERQALTDEEQTMWDESRAAVSWYLAAFQQFGLFRLRSDEQNKAYQEAMLVIEEITGYTPEQQTWLREHGHRLWDMIGGLSPTHQEILKEMDYYRWVGQVRPLLPGKQQVILDKIELAWNEVETFTEDIAASKLELQGQFLQGTELGRIGPQDYNDQLTDLYADQRKYILNKMKEQITESVPAGLTGTDIEEFIEEHSLMTIEGRADYYKKYNIPQPILHPFRELLNLFFSIKLEDMVDPATGEKVKDWDRFWAEREAIEDAIPEGYEEEWKTYMARNSTRIEETRRNVYSKYFRKYNQLWDEVLTTQFNDEEQQQIVEYLFLEKTGSKLDRQEEIKAIVRENGNQLISDFRGMVTESRQALRYANPNLDAWLFYWGRTKSFLTPQAELAYQQIAVDTGRDIQ